MAEVASAYVSLLPSARGFGRKLDSQIGGQVGASGKKAGLTFGSLFKAALGSAAVLKGIRFFGDTITEAREAAVVTARTSNVIKSMGLTSKVSAGQIAALSTAISNKTGIDDEQIQSGENLLLTFKSIASSAGVVGGVFDQTTRLAVDMSSALGVSMKSASIQLGKALNDPIKGLTALTRSGVSFTAQQQEQIKTLVASGETLKAQNIILGEVGKQFGGAAAAMSTPADKARVSVANLKEQIGTSLLPVVNTLANFITTSAVPAISGFISGMQAGTGAGGRLASVLGFVRDHIRGISVVLGVGVVVWAAYKTAMLVAAITSKVVLVATKAYTAGQWLLNAALTANPIGLVIVALAALGVGLVIAYKKSETFRNIVNGAFDAVKGAISDLAGKVDSFVNGFKDKLGSAVSFAQSIPNKISGAFSAAGSLLVSAGKAIVSGLIGGIKSMAGAAADAAIGVVKGALDAAKSLLGIHSPSTAFRTVGEQAIEGLVDGLSSKKLSDKAKAALQTLIDGLKTKLSGLKSALSSVASTVASAFTPDVFGGSGTDLLNGLFSNVGNLTAVTAAFKKLKKIPGVSAAFLSQLLASGNTGLILELASGPDTTTALASSMFDTQTSLSDSLGQSVGMNQFGDKIQGVRDEIRELRKDLKDNADRTGEAVADALNRVGATAIRTHTRRVRAA